jgi:hypothetical protein
MNVPFNINKLPILPKYILDYIVTDLNLSKDTTSNLWLEFGVFSGRTVNFLAKANPNKVIHGFDSFEGLPEKWRDGFDKGTFSLNGNLPQVEKNVVLHKGWFEDSLPAFLSTNTNKINFLHLDADLYSSTSYVLNQVTHLLEDNCIIVFDELINFPGYDSDTSELKAFVEWVDKFKINYEVVGVCPVLPERVAIKLKR